MEPEFLTRLPLASLPAAWIVCIDSALCRERAGGGGGGAPFICPQASGPAMERVSLAEQEIFGDQRLPTPARGTEQAEGEKRAARPRGLGRRVVQSPQGPGRGPTAHLPQGARTLNVKMWTEDKIPKMG